VSAGGGNRPCISLRQSFESIPRAKYEVIRKFQPSDIQFRLAAARRILYRQGCDSGIAGHVTVRAEDDALSFWTTPMSGFDEALPTDAAKMDSELRVLEGAMPTPGAMGFHPRIYRARQDINAIVHIHSRHINVLVTTGRTVGMYNIASLMFYERQVICPALGEGPDRGAGNLDEILGDKRVMLMPHHGAIIVGTSLEEAVIHAITLEEAAGCHLAAQVGGGVEITNERVIKGLRTSPAINRMTWESNLRRLQRSDPDLFSCLA
jgi:L-fuculose-phosphate aldolase